jgi:ectoine hydroxylase-related dioxygenase (phytanoyl-CoA dioxygenase family)
MPKRLSEREVETYRRDGALFPVTVMSEAEAEDHRRRLEAAEAAHGKMHYLTKPYLLFSSANEIARHPRLLDAVEDILGPDILLWNSAYVIKEARDQRYVSWHQDLTYWGLDSDALVTAWAALSPATPENGGMRVVPGSHRNGVYDHHDTHASDNILHRGQKVTEVDEAAAVDIELVPGQASLHHGWVLHASGSNPTGDRRVGLTVQYLAPSARQTLSHRESATLVRGIDRYGHFQPEPEFSADFAPEAVAFQQDADRLKHEIYDRA